MIIISITNLQSLLIKRKNSKLILSKHNILKTGLPKTKLKAFYRMKIYSYESLDSVEGVMLHFKESMIILPTKSNNVVDEILGAFSKHDVIITKDKSAIFLWDDKRDKIERINLPYDRKSEKSIQKVYGAANQIICFKLVNYNNHEYLYVIDEPKLAKLFKVEEDKAIIYKEYFVNHSFATNVYDKDAMISIFCDGMVYSSHGGYLLQENGRQIDSKIEKVDVTNHSLSFPNKKTPIYSNGYILWFLDPYMKGEYEGCQDILLIPPINSYSIRQRLLDECSNNEFLLHFDDNYIIHSGKYPYNIVL